MVCDLWYVLDVKCGWKSESVKGMRMVSGRECIFLLGCNLQGRASMDMMYPEIIGRESWDRVIA